jgi:hypothetical protein
MPSFKVIYDQTVADQIQRLDPYDQQEAQNAIQLLEKDPFTISNCVNLNPISITTLMRKHTTPNTIEIIFVADIAASIVNILSVTKSRWGRALAAIKFAPRVRPRN